MSIQLALSKATNDLIKLPDGGVSRVSDGRYTTQLVQNKLLTSLGEWALDPTIGWIGTDDFERNPDLFDIELRARLIILGTKGVQTIDSFSLELTNRTLYLKFTASTIYGGIDLTVPWSL